MIPQKTIYTEMTAPPYLLEQFRGTSLETLLKIIDNQYQALEAAATDIFEKVWIDKAEGVNLDVLGIHLDVARNGMSDNNYRVALHFKCRMIRAKGTAEALIEAVKFLYNPPNLIYIPVPPGKVSIYHDGNLALLDETNILLSDDNLVVNEDGDFLIFTESQAELKLPLLESVIPVGVKLTLNQTTFDTLLLNDGSDNLIDHEGNPFIVWEF